MISPESPVLSGNIMPQRKRGKGRRPLERK
jgi:hypothetical protein